MSSTTSIEWATKSWGPVLGCKKVSAGCDNCYAIRTAHRLASNPNPKVSGPYAGLTLRGEYGLDWTGVVRTLPARLGDPLRWRKPERIFVNSQSDLFHPAVGVDFTAQVFARMAITPRHTYQILTKRPDVALKVLTQPTFMHAFTMHAGFPTLDVARSVWPLSNVWIGVSVEDQATADDRIPKLLQIPAARRWISAEPLLGPLDLVEHLANTSRPSLDWVVTGGESGPGARPAHPDWFRSIRDQCVAAVVPLLHKQNGAWVPTEPGDGVRPGDVCVTPDGFTDTAGPDYVCFANESEGTVLRRVGKKAAGRHLDGVLHDAFPEPVR